MATTRAFSIGELIRHLTYDSSTDKLTTSKSINTEGKTRKSKTTTTTSSQTLDSFAKATYKSALYHVAAHKSTDFHSSLFFYCVFLDRFSFYFFFLALYVVLSVNFVFISL